MKKLQLSLAEITEIGKSIGDVCYLELDSGYSCTLVGAFSRCLFLVAGRNVGPLSQYILASENSTNYLSELKEGKKVLSINNLGEIREVTVKKNEIKREPCILLNARCEDIVDERRSYYKPSDVSMFIQDSHESRLVSENNRHVSVKDLRTGSKVLVYVGLYGYGRHFGSSVKDVELIER